LFAIVVNKSVANQILTLQSDSYVKTKAPAFSNF